MEDGQLSIGNRGGAARGQVADSSFGALQPDGSRVGGMVANQKQLLSLDTETNRSDTRFLLTGQRILLAVGLILIIAIAVVTARAISKPVVQMTARWVDWPTGMLADVPAQGRQDEIGQMAHAVQVFKDNMIKARELESEQAAAHAAEQKRAQTIDNRTGTFDSVNSGRWKASRP